MAATAVGFGVTNDGATYRSGYDTLPSESLTGQFSIGPGSAPEAGVIALKVFGDSGGSTALTGAALEWIAREVAGGTDIDVVNMSLGMDHGSVDDPDGRKLEALMDAGVLPVIAAGNAGDLVDVSGSPGNTNRVLTVAASASGHGLGDAVYGYVGDPNAVERQEVLSQFSQNYTDPFNLTARVVAPLTPANLTGCAAFSADDAARITGNIVWLAWNDADVACGSATRFTNAANAGAVGVLLESQGDAFENGIAGSAQIPGAQLSKTGVDLFRPGLEAGNLFVQLTSDGAATLPYFVGARVDTLASFSSRGVHGSFDNTLKPDVAAPGVNMTSAASGTGNGRSTKSGTSMATPHVAGIAALLVQAHPDWNPDRIKMQIMNTANHDIVTGGENSIAYGPARAGTGRVDALAAVRSLTTIQSVENGNLVSASFGPIEVGAQPVTETRTIRLTNDAARERRLSLHYEARTETPGVRYSLSSDAVTIAAGASADVTLTVHIDDPGALRRTLDPTMVAMQGGAPRQYLADASGVLIAEGDDADPDIRLSVYSAPKPVSETTVSAIAFDGTSGTLTSTGRGLDQGTGSEKYGSIMVPLVLGAEDPDDTFPEDSAVATLESVDILAVGASTTAPQLADPSQGVLTVGMLVDKNWSAMNPLSYPMVQLDLNSDRRSDFAILLRPADGADTPLAVTVDVVTGRTVDQRPVNEVFGDTGTNVFDNNVLSMSVSLAALGYTPATTHTTINYSVQTRSFYAPKYDGTYRSTLVDDTAGAAIDAYRPAVWFGNAGDGASRFEDTAGTLPVHRNAGDTSRVLVLHLHGENGERSQIITPTAVGGGTPTPTGAPSPEPTNGAAGPVTQPSPSTSATPRPAGSNGDLANTGGDAGPLWAASIAALGALIVGATLVVRRRRAGLSE